MKHSFTHGEDRLKKCVVKPSKRVVKPDVGCPYVLPPFKALDSFRGIINRAGARGGKQVYSPSLSLCPLRVSEPFPSPLSTLTAKRLCARPWEEGIAHAQQE